MALPDVSHLDQKTKDELAGLSLALSSGKTRKGFLGLMKQAAPDMPIPEVEQDAAIAAATKPLQEALDKTANEFRDYRLQNELGAKRKAAAEKHGLSEADVKKMEEMMGKKELPADYDWAAPLYKQQIEQVTPNYGTSGYGPVELPTDEALMADPDRWAGTAAHKIIDELRAKSGVRNF